MRVLHVVESLGGGVLSSVLSMVDATSDIDHQLAIWHRREHADTGDQRAVFGGVHDLPGPPHRAARSLRDLVAALAPDLVHAHSSYAGVLARSSDLGVPVAYSPHCFAFERTDLGTMSRTALREVERSLVRRTDVLVACSPHEAGLAAELGFRRVVTVPNRALHPPEGRVRRGEPFRVVAVGRVAAQKDWRHLIAVKREADRQAVADESEPLRWEWLGSGDADGEDALRDAGVEVSGWLPRTEVLARLGSAQAYLHTAAWEGAPVSILEAAAIGLPIVARALPTLVSDDVPGLESTVEGLAERLLDLRGQLAWTRAHRRSLAFSDDHSVSLQRYRLTTAYRHVPAAARRRPEIPGAGMDHDRLPDALVR
ncbi:glycosyltransferase [Nocardioides nitrophenolicus]|uniref:glycosyltransferase n=1 Tax=Nocardioides nitrophenolicus TaxID=60489 RepID=UPI00195639A4|nr:glycosyltransferase [Nocardioides nitrophenolicus]MBM7520306.1 glycosyltransferase involved in cell wall biosynthesis [Nocardioides nitrophenolicus]